MPGRVQAHAHRHGQPVLARPQRAHVVAQPLGQHGQNAVHQVGRAGARPRLKVDARSPGHVVRHVGNVDVQVKAAVGPLARAHRVVEVTRIGRVDGHTHDTPQVLPRRVGR